MIFVVMLNYFWTIRLNLWWRFKLNVCWLYSACKYICWWTRKVDNWWSHSLNLIFDLDPAYFHHTITFFVSNDDNMEKTCRKISAMWKLCVCVVWEKEKIDCSSFEARNSHYFSDKIASHVWRFLCWILPMEIIAFLSIFEFGLFSKYFTNKKRLTFSTLMTYFLIYARFFYSSLKSLFVGANKQAVN